MDTSAVKKATKELAAAERSYNKALDSQKKVVAKAVAKAEEKSSKRIAAALAKYDAAKAAMSAAVAGK